MAAGSTQYISDTPEINNVHKFVLTMIWFLTLLTPSVSVAICTARSRAGKLPTVPLRVTLLSTVLIPIAYWPTVESAPNLRRIVAEIVLSDATCELLRVSVDPPLSVLDALPSSSDVHPAADKAKIAINKTRIPDPALLPKRSRNCTQMVSYEHGAVSDFDL
jgi:hypothetical protein